MSQSSKRLSVMTHVYLIRHGQAVVNVKPIIGGMKADTGLTDIGIAQAERLRDRLSATGEIKADVLIASTLPRASQTARIIAPAFDLPIIDDDDVQELRPGEADGLTFDEYRAQYGSLSFNPVKPLSPGGETWRTFTQRTAAAFERIVSEHAGKTIVVVCHGWVIESSFGYFMGLGDQEAPSLGFQVDNTAITLWEQFERNGEQRWRLGCYNDAVHLHANVRWDTDIDAAEHPAVPLE